MLSSYVAGVLYLEHYFPYIYIGTLELFWLKRSEYVLKHASIKLYITPSFLEIL